MTKLRRFPSLGGNSSNNDASATTTVSQQQKRNHRHPSPFQQRIIGRHVSPFRTQQAPPPQRSMKPESLASMKRSKTPGRVRWFVNPGALVHGKHADNNTSTSEISMETIEAAAFVLDLTQSKTTDTVESEASSQAESTTQEISMEREAVPPATPTRRVDPEQTLSMDTTPARSNRTSHGMAPLLNTIELVASSSFSHTDHDASSVSTNHPPDPEGLELWTTPTKPRHKTFIDNDGSSNSSCNSSSNSEDENSRLLLFGDDDDTQPTETSHGFHSAVAVPFVERNTAEEAARGACDDLTSPRDGVALLEDFSEHPVMDGLEEEENDSIVNKNSVGDDDDNYDDDDYTYTPSLAPSAGFVSVSPSSCYAEDGDPSLVKGQRPRTFRDGESGEGYGGGGNTATPPPKEVLAMTADGGIRNDNAGKKDKSHTGDDKDDAVVAAEKEDIRIAREMASNLLRELETVREEKERLVSRNRRLATHLHDLKVHQEEHLIYRSRLIKACMCVSPVFLLCGGLDIFCVTILLVWVLVEAESYMDLGDEKAGDLNEGDLASVMFDQETD
jgi:hypothetical protein